MATWEDVGIEIPTGARGHIKTRCPWCSDSRKTAQSRRERCLYVNADEGLWKCYNCDQRGSLATGSDTLTYGHRLAPLSHRKPAPITCSSMSSGALTWFTERKISPSSLEKFGVTATDDAIKFPYIRHGELVNVKTRYRGKRFAMEEGCELILWGIDHCQGATQTIVVEGELDALALDTAGIPHVLSVPNGAQAGSMGYLESGENIFAHCHSVIIAVDNDEPGIKLESELIRRIGKEKCYRVRWPEGCKDANDVLMAHGTSALCRAIADAEPLPLDGIVTPRQLLTESLVRYRTGKRHGETTGFMSLDNLYTVRSGQLTIVSGVPGSGKSSVLDSIMLNMIQRHGWFFGVFSPENYPLDAHMEKLAKKWTGKPYYAGAIERMTEQELIEFHEVMEGMLHFMNPDEVKNIDEILDRAQALIMRHGLRGLILDPWNRIETMRPSSVTETEYIGQCLSKLQWFARNHDIHIWLVAHPRIMRRAVDGSVPVVTAYDLAGSANFYNMSDNILVVHRHKEDSSLPVEVYVQKVRFSDLGRLGKCELLFDAVCEGYRDTGRWEAS